MNLIKNIRKPKELWKTLKSLGFLNKVSIATINALNNDKVVQYDPKSISKAFQSCFVNLAETLLQKLPPPPNKYGIDSVNKFYRDLDINTKFQLKQTTEDVAPKLFKNIKVSKAGGIDNGLAERSLNYEAVDLLKPVVKICNFSRKSRIYLDPHKLAKYQSRFRTKHSTGLCRISSFILEW